MYILEQLILDQPHSADLDCWTYVWGASFSVSKAYALFMDGPEPHPSFKWLWSSCCQKKHKVFFWLLLRNRLNTREKLQMKDFFLPNYSCVLCNERVLETRDHLFFKCPFAKFCWDYLYPGWQPSSNGLDMIVSLKQNINKPFFMELIIFVTRAILKTRNSFIFEQKRTNLYRCRAVFNEELQWLKHRATRKAYSGY